MNNIPKGPYRSGDKSEFGTYRPDVIFDANGDSIAQVYGVPLNCTLEETIESIDNWPGLKDDRLKALSCTQLLTESWSAYQALKSLVSMIAGDQHSEDEIDRAFNLPGLGNKIREAWEIIGRIEKDPLS